MTPEPSVPDDPDRTVALDGWDPTQIVESAGAPQAAGAAKVAAEDGGDLAGLDAKALLAGGLQSAPRAKGWKPPEPEALARLLPQYEIESLLGRGGMGAVYRGRQAALDRPVAIKLLPAEMAADAEFVGRFQREARTLARMQHPGIVAVHDFGQTAEGHLYFVMEFVDGTDLYRVIHGPGLKAEEALEIVTQVCEALQYAHSHGVMHRDIKPANVLLNKEGRAKLADFGLARPVEEDSGAYTRSHMVMGTPDYIAPEQMTGHADHRADLFSLGVMLYEMLTGQTPRGAWAPPSQRVRVDVRLDQVVVRALQQDVSLRYQQASEMKTDVDAVRFTPPPAAEAGLPARGAPAAAPPPLAAAPVAGRPGAARGAGMVAVVVSVVLAAAGIWWVADKERPGISGQARDASGKGRAVTSSLPPRSGAGAEADKEGAGQTVAADQLRAPAWLEEARRRGGRVRAFGSTSKGPFSVESLERFDDFQEVAVSQYGWAARRTNGVVLALTGLTDPRYPLTQHGPFMTTRLQASEPIYMRLAGEGGWRNVFNTDCQELKHLAHPEGVAFLNAYDHTVVLASDGRMLFNQGWNAPLNADKKSPPPDFFLGATAWSFSNTTYFAAQPGGKVGFWNVNNGSTGVFHDAREDIAELKSGWVGNVVIRTASGRVMVLNGKGLPSSLSSPPASLPPAIAVRGTSDVCAAQMTDGTWVAWGEPQELVDQIAKIGPALDLACYSDKEKGSFMMWVEAAGEAELARGAAADGARVKKEGETIQAANDVRSPAETDQKNTSAVTVEALLDWVFRGGGSVELMTGGASWTVREAAVMPPAPVNIIAIETSPLHEQEMTDEQFRALALIPTLQRLRAIGPNFNVTKLEPLQNLTALRSLDLGAYSKGVPEAELRHLAGLKALESLNIRVSGRTGENCDVLRGLPRLTSLGLMGEGVLTEKGVESLASLLKLKTLNLDAVDPATQTRLGRLSALANVETFSLGGTAPTAEILGHVAAMPKLKKLQIGNSPGARPGCFSALGPAAGHLAELVFYMDAGPDDEAVREIVAALPGLQFFSRLYCKDRCTPAALKELAKLAGLKRLGWCHAKDEDCALLEGFAGVEQLDLQGRALTDAALAHLSRMPRIKRVDLKQTQVTATAVETFRLANPRIELYLQP